MSELAGWVLDDTMRHKSTPTYSSVRLPQITQHAILPEDQGSLAHERQEKAATAARHPNRQEPVKSDEELSKCCVRHSRSQAVTCESKHDSFSSDQRD